MNAKQWQKINEGRQDLYPSYAHCMAEVIRGAGGLVPADFTQCEDPMQRIKDVQGVFDFKRADGENIDVIFSLTLHEDDRFYVRIILDDHLEPVNPAAYVGVTGQMIKQAVWNVINVARRRAWPTRPEYWPVALEG